MNPHQLALFGGAPVREASWPKWPRADKHTLQLLAEVLDSGRWSISGVYSGASPFERRFAKAFADYHDVPYAVPCASGTAALTIALEAAGVCAGREVLVPGLTWVACASSVAALNAIPVLVDIDPASLCMSLSAAEAAITAKTAAIILVHSYCNLGDIPGFVALASRTGIPLIEDCSQAHGALWNNRRVGTFGTIGVFSMQSSKTLTSGEGGCCIVRDAALFCRLQQFRADGREYKGATPEIGEMELVPVGSVQGHNYCLSEFHAAILLDRLGRLDAENTHRRERAATFSRLMHDTGCIEPVRGGLTFADGPIYRFCLRLERAAFRDLPVEVLARAMTTELGLPIVPVDRPLRNNVLYRPDRSARIAASSQILRMCDPKGFYNPEAERARRECICIPHYAFLGEDQDLADIVTAAEKVRANAGMIAQAFDYLLTTNDNEVSDQ